MTLKNVYDFLDCPQDQLIHLLSSVQRYMQKFRGDVKSIIRTTMDSVRTARQLLSSTPNNDFSKKQFSPRKYFYTQIDIPCDEIIVKLFCLYYNILLTAVTLILHFWKPKNKSKQWWIFHRNLIQPKTISLILSRVIKPINLTILV